MHAPWKACHDRVLAHGFFDDVAGVRELAQVVMLQPPAGPIHAGEQPQAFKLLQQLGLHLGVGGNAEQGERQGVGCGLEAAHDEGGDFSRQLLICQAFACIHRQAG